MATEHSIFFLSHYQPPFVQQSHKGQNDPLVKPRTKFQKLCPIISKTKKCLFHQVWCTSGEGVDAMRVVYRMRGLLGDATEEFVERLTQANAEAVDDEQLYRMANVLADCGMCLPAYYCVKL